MPKQLDRIEASITKLQRMMTTLLDALEDEAQDDEPERTLDGSFIGGERDDMDVL